MTITTHQLTKPETNKLIAYRFLELIGAGHWDQLGALITPEWTMIGGPPGLPHGQAGLAALAAAIGPVQQLGARIEDGAA